MSQEGIVKDQLKRQGIRLVDVEAKEIGRMAMLYIATHPEEVYAEVKARLAARVPHSLSTRQMVSQKAQSFQGGLASQTP
jgi:hypothetical protein